MKQIWGKIIIIAGYTWLEMRWTIHIKNEHKRSSRNPSASLLRSKGNSRCKTIMWSHLSNHRRWFTVIHRIFIHTFNKMAASCLWDLNWISNITELYKGRLITFTYEYIEMTYFRIIVCTLKCLIWLFLLILTVFVKSAYLGGGE